MQSTPLERILGKVDDLDSVNLTILVQRLARERKLLEAVFHSIQEGVLVLDRSGLIQYANDSACRMIHLDRKDVGSAIFWKLVPNVAQSLDLAAVGDLAETPVISREIELTYPEHRFVHLQVVPFSEGEEELPKFAFILTDVTSSKVATEERIESEKVSSIFLLAAGVAHELGNPLNSLNIHLQLMQRQVAKMEEGPAKEQLCRSLGVCSKETLRLDGIIKNFLEAIRPSPPNFQVLDPIDLIEESLDFLGPELKDLGVEVQVDLPKVLLEILGDRNQLKQVFFNILKNAMESMREGGHITIRVEALEEEVLVIFADTGEGISQEDLSRIFEPYFTTKSGGSGLGMMIVQRILRDHGATIGIDSQLTKGSVITLSFPHKDKRVKMLG